MIDRINLILRAKNITAKQFAEEIGIQPSGMSHIMGGRNNPSLEFVNKVIRRYPEIDANWLLLGKGEMYSELRKNDEEIKTVQEPTLFTSRPEPVPVQEPLKPELNAEPELEPEPAPDSLFRSQEHKPFDLDAKEKAENNDPAVKEEPTPEKNDSRRLVKILFCYDDRTFEEYTNLC